MDKDALIRIKIDESGAVRTLANLAKRLDAVFTSNHFANLTKYEAGLSRINDVAKDLAQNLKTVSSSLSHALRTVNTAGTPRVIAPVTQRPSPQTNPSLPDPAFAARIQNIRTALQEQFNALGRNKNALNELDYSRLAKQLVAVSTQLNNINSQFDKSGKATTQMEGRLDNLSARLNVFGKSLDRTGNSLDSIANKSTRAGLNLFLIGQNAQQIGNNLTNYLTRPITNFGTASLETQADIESLLLAINTLTKDAGETRRQFELLRQDAKRPGLGLEEAVRANLQLQSTQRVTFEQAREIVNEFSKLNALSGGKAQNFAEVITQITQALGTGKLLSTDFRPLFTQLPILRSLIEETFETSDLDVLRGKNIEPLTVFEKLLPKIRELGAVAGGTRNTLDNLADSLKIVGYNIGNAIAPVLIPLIDYLSENLPPLIESLSKRFQELPKFVQYLSIAFAGLVAVAGPVITILGTIAAALSSIASLFGAGGALAGIGATVSALLGPIGIAVAAIVAALGVLAVAFTTNFAGIRDSVTEAVSFISSQLEAAGNYLSKFWQENGEQIKEAAATVYYVLETILSPVVKNVLAQIAAFGKGFLLILSEIGKGFLATVKGISQIINGDFSGAFETIKERFNSLYAFAQNWFEIFSSAARTILLRTADFILSVLIKIVDGIYYSLVRIGIFIKENWQRIWENAKNVVVNALEKLIAIFENFPDKVFGALVVLTAVVLKALSSAVQALVSKGKEIGAAAYNIGVEIVDFIVSGVANGDLFARLLTLVSNSLRRLQSYIRGQLEGTPSGDSPDIFGTVDAVTAAAGIAKLTGKIVTKKKDGGGDTGKGSKGKKGQEDISALESQTRILQAQLETLQNELERNISNVKNEFEDALINLSTYTNRVKELEKEIYDNTLESIEAQERLALSRAKGAREREALEEEFAQKRIEALNKYNERTSSIDRDQKNRIKESEKRHEEFLLKLRLDSDERKIELTKKFADEQRITFQDAEDKIIAIQKASLIEQYNLANKALIERYKLLKSQGEAITATVINIGDEIVSIEDVKTTDARLQELFEAFKKFQSELKKLTDEETKRREDAAKKDAETNKKSLEDARKKNEELKRIREENKRDELEELRVRKERLEILIEKEGSSFSLRKQLKELEREIDIRENILKEQFHIEELRRRREQAESLGARAEDLERIDALIQSATQRLLEYQRLLSEGAQGFSLRDVFADIAAGLEGNNPLQPLFNIIGRISQGIDNLIAKVRGPFTNVLKALGNVGKASLNVIANAVAQVADTFIKTGKISLNEFRKLVADALKTLAREYLVKSIAQLAEGFAMLFLNPPRAAAHFKASALYGIAAAAAGGAGFLAGAGLNNSDTANSALNSGAGSSSQSNQSSYDTDRRGDPLEVFALNERRKELQILITTEDRSTIRAIAREQRRNAFANVVGQYVTVSPF